MKYSHRLLFPGCGAANGRDRETIQVINKSAILERELGGVRGGPPPPFPPRRTLSESGREGALWSLIYRSERGVGNTYERRGP